MSLPENVREEIATAMQSSEGCWDGEQCCNDSLDAALPVVERLVDEARAEVTAGRFWTDDEWQEWSNELASLIPDGDESRYSNPEGAQEGIIRDCLAAYVAERQGAAALTAAVRELPTILVEKPHPFDPTASSMVETVRLDDLCAVLDAADTTAFDRHDARVQVEAWDAALRWVRQQADVTSPEYVLDRIDRAEPFNPYRADAQTSDDRRTHH